MKTICIVLFALAGAACCTLPKAGEVYVSAVSVTDWAVYGSQFQPRFQLSEKEALGLAVADTGQFESSLLDSKQANLRAHYEESVSVNVGADEVDKPSEPPAMSEAKGILDLAKLDVDPRLQYLLATALWQEVQVLNRYVHDAATGSAEDVIPYVLRLQIDCLPPTVDASYVQDITLTFGDCVDVLPLLINDHIEAAIASRREQEIRRLTIALEAMLKGVGVAGSYDSYRNQIQQSLVREFHPLLSIAKSGPSQLRVRIGPRRVGDRRYVATTEPRFVTVLVLVPTDSECWEVQEAGGQDAKDSYARPGSRKKTLTSCYETRFRDPISGRQANGVFTGSFAVQIERLSDGWLRSEQTALAYDDGVETRVTLNDATDVLPSDVVASWFFKDGRSDVLHALGSGEIEYDGRNRTLVFHFPSLSKLGVHPEAKGVPERFVRRELARPLDKPVDCAESAGVAVDTNDRNARHATSERSFVVKMLWRNREQSPAGDSVYLFYPWIYKAKDKTALQAGFKVTVNRSKLPAKDTSLKVHCTLPKNDDGTPVKGFKVYVSGADAAIAVNSTSGVLAAAGGKPENAFDILTTGTGVIDLTGLFKGAVITVSFKGPNGYAVPADLKLEVVKD